MATSVQISIQATMYGRVYQNLVDIKTEPEFLQPHGWLAFIFTRVAELSRLNPFPSITRTALPLLMRFAASGSYETGLCGIPMEKVTNGMIHEFLVHLELFIDSCDLSEFNKASHIWEVHRLIVVCLKGQYVSERIHRKAIGFRTRFERKTKKQLMLSDGSGFLSGESEAEPIGAISHSTYAELYRATKERVDSDLNILIDCCVSDLERVDAIRQKMNKLALVDVPSHIIEHVRRAIIYGANSHSVNKSFKELPSEFVLPATIRLLDEIKGVNAYKRSLVTVNGLGPHVLEHFGDLNDMYSKYRLLLESRYICCGQELLAIFIILLCHTGWNPGSLVEMSRENIVRKGSQWELQGFKSKTDDDTPVVVLTKDDRGADKAIRQLIWHHDRLKEDGIITDGSLWFTSFLCGAEVIPNVGLVNRNKFFIRHGLEPFVLSQIRNQVLERDRLHGLNLDMVRRRGGHKSVDTTASYLDSLLNRRMFSSINYEFSRRLEETVIFRLQEIGKLENQACDRSKVREALIMPIGDGASCENLDNPPDNAIVRDGHCSALTCHVGDGCVHRRIIVDNQSIEALVRKRRYYINNWERLESNNPAAFREFEMPSMLFVMGLYSYIKNTTYKIFLVDAERRINE